MTTRSPEVAAFDAAQGPPRYLVALERAHTLAHRAARVLEGAAPSTADLAPPARALEAAIGAIYAAIDVRDDRLQATEAAQNELDITVMTLGGLVSVDPAFADAIEWIREARETLDVAIERFSRVPPESPPEPVDLRASKDIPSLHRIDRPSLLPTIRVPAPLVPPPDAPPPLPRPKSLEELDKVAEEVRRRAEERKKARAEREAERARLRAERLAREAAENDNEPPTGYARGRFTAVTEGDFLATRARECFEEVAMVGSQRAPLLGDPWRIASTLEKRMLASIDGVASLGGPALARIEPLVVEAPAKDPSRGFAAAMILGCFDGRDALGAIERVLFHLGPGDPEVARAVGGALALVPHPGLADMLRSLLAESDPAIRALAIEVLAYRGLATVPELVAASQDASPAVAAVALPALAVPRPPELGAAIEAARAHDEPAMREAAWHAMALSGHPHASDALVSELTGPLAARAAVPLAIVGDDRDAERLLASMRASPSSAIVNAVGWAGAPDAVGPLIDLLGHDDPVLQLTAAYALDRITGARMYESVEVPPETILVPEVDEPDVGEPRPRPLAHAVSDPRDRPSEGANDTVTQPTINADRWRGHWAEKGPEYKPKIKYRRGSPYTPAISLWELDTWPLTPGERRWLQRELVARTGHYVRFDVHDFVAVQEEALKEWAPIAQRMSGSAGSWVLPMRR